jgi:hypothetical protein
MNDGWVTVEKGMSPVHRQAKAIQQPWQGGSSNQANAQLKVALVIDELSGEGINAW